MTMNEPGAPDALNAAVLFRSHRAFVARFLYRLGVPAQAIEDTVQDVFLVVHQRGGYRAGPAKPTTYLAVIASHVAASERRQQRRRAARHGHTSVEELQANGEDPAHRVELRDELCRLQVALSRLEPALRDTLVRADLEEETAPAIARDMGVPLGTVYWRLHEARKQYRVAAVRAWGHSSTAPLASGVRQGRNAACKHPVRER